MAKTQLEVTLSIRFHLLKHQWLYHAPVIFQSATVTQTIDKLTTLTAAQSLSLEILLLRREGKKKNQKHKKSTIHALLYLLSFNKIVFILYSEGPEAFQKHIKDKFIKCLLISTADLPYNTQPYGKAVPLQDLPLQPIQDEGKAK